MRTKKILSVGLIAFVVVGCMVTQGEPQKAPSTGNPQADAVRTL